MQYVKDEINNFKKFAFDQLNDSTVFNLDINNFVTPFLDDFDYYGVTNLPDHLPTGLLSRVFLYLCMQLHKALRLDSLQR